MSFICEKWLDNICVDVIKTETTDVHMKKLDIINSEYLVNQLDFLSSVDFNQM